MSKNDIVKYNNKSATLLWFNPCEREWMIRTNDGQIYFVTEAELKDANN